MDPMNKSQLSHHESTIFCDQDSPNKQIHEDNITQLHPLADLKHLAKEILILQVEDTTKDEMINSLGKTVMELKNKNSELEKNLQVANQLHYKSIVTYLNKMSEQTANQRTQREYIISQHELQSTNQKTEVTLLRKELNDAKDKITELTTKYFTYMMETNTKLSVQQYQIDSLKRQLEIRQQDIKNFDKQRQTIAESIKKKEEDIKSITEKLRVATVKFLNQETQKKKWIKEYQTLKINSQERAKSLQESQTRQKQRRTLFQKQKEQLQKLLFLQCKSGNPRHFDEIQARVKSLLKDSKDYQISLGTISTLEEQNKALVSQVSKYQSQNNEFIRVQTIISSKVNERTSTSNNNMNSNRIEKNQSPSRSNQNLRINVPNQKQDSILFLLTDNISQCAKDNCLLIQKMFDKDTTNTLQIAKLKNDLKQSSNKQNDALREIEKLNQVIRDKIAEITRKNSQLKNKDAQIIGLNSKVKTLEIDLVKITNQLKKANDQIKSLLATIVELQKKLSQAQTRILGLNSELKNLKDKSDQQKAVLQNKSRILKEQTMPQMQRRFNTQKQALQDRLRNEKEEALRAEKEKAKREAQTVEDEHRKVCADLGAKITAAEIKANDCYKRMDELQMTRLKNYQRFSQKISQILRFSYELTPKNYETKLDELCNEIKNKLLSSGVLVDSDILQNMEECKREYLMHQLQNFTKRHIKKSKLVYKYDPYNPTNFHQYIDEKDHLLLICRLSNGIVVGGYTEAPFASSKTPRGDCGGLLFSLTTEKSFYPKTTHHGSVVSYDKFYIIYGNAEIRIRFNSKEFFSNFGIVSAIFESEKKTVSDFIGQQKRQMEFSTYELYQLTF